jgi:adenylate cyclase
VVVDGAFRVRDWRVEPQLNTIADGTRTLHLEPKVMRVLVYLAEHGEEVVAKERVIHAVWPDTFVTDDVLTDAISELRRAFGDDAREPRFIQTVPKGGYRLIAPVYRDSTDDQRALETGGPHRTNRALVGIAVALLAGAAAAFLHSHGQDRAQPIDSLVVLPFVNVDGGPDDEYVSEGLTDGVIDSLARVPGLRVISHTSAFRYKRQHTDPRTVGRELGVQAVLTGTVRVRP